MARPLEQRALGLAMRRAKRKGVIEAPKDLVAIVDSLSISNDDVDCCLDLLVDDEGRTVGGLLSLDDLSETRIFDLWAQGVIEQVAGTWLPTDKGKVFARLLDEYANPKYHWRAARQRAVNTRGDE